MTIIFCIFFCWSANGKVKKKYASHHTFITALCDTTLYNHNWCSDKFATRHSCNPTFVRPDIM